jgi:hypothetical protein
MLLLAGGLASQQFAALRQSPLDSPVDPAFLDGIPRDVDGNGTVDVLLRRGALLLGDGQLRFQFVPPGVRIPTQSLGFPSTFGIADDINLDGNVDLIRTTLSFVPLQTTILVLPGLAGGFWGPAVPACSFAGLHATEGLRDVDGDSYPDLFVWNGLGPGPGASLGLLRNLRNGTFLDVTATSLPAVALGRPLFADFDGDADVDFVASSTSGLQLLLNNGSGVFTFATASGLPSLASVAALRCGDADADGDQDLLIAAAAGSPLQLWINNGGGVFTPAPGFLPKHGRSTLFEDLDGDGAADLLLVTDSTPYPHLQAWHNSGTGTFTPRRALRIDNARDFGDPELADLDGDSDLDVVLGGTLFFVDEGNQVYAPLWREAAPGNADVLTVVAGDLDGDGAIDLVHGTAVYRNDGDGYFAPTKLSLPAGAAARALFDADGDGDLDVVWTNADPTATSAGGIVLNQNGGFLALPPLRSGQLLGRVVVADFDGDGRPDLCSEAGLLLRNLGSGSFNPAGTPLPANVPIAVGDFDQDGRVDLAISPPMQPWQHWRNLGNFVFQLVASLPGNFDAAVAGDVDGDGDVDLAATVLTSSYGGRFDNMYLWLNQNGQFQFSWQGTDGITSPATVALVDLDEDGDLDFVGGSVWLNSGNGTFVLSSDSCFNAAIGDFDRDGDVDLACPAPARAVVLTNLQRQLSSPRVPVLGRPYEIVMASRLVGGGPAAGAFVMPAFAFTRIAPAVVPGLGVLHLDPQQAMFVAPAFTAPDGTHTFSFVVPALPALAGVSVFWQGVVAGANGVRLTGCVADRIVP